MSTVPSRQLTFSLAIAAAASLLIIPFPSAGLLLLASNLVLVLAALLDWMLTPRPRAVEVTRLAPERLSVLRPQVVTLLVRNRSAAALWVRVRDSWPVGWDADTEELAGRLKPAEEAR